MISLLPREAKQAVRIRRYLLASAVSVFYLLVLLVFEQLGAVDRRTLTQATLLVLALIVGFYLVFRTGLNLRAPDPSLTLAQVLSAVFTMLYVAYEAPGTRPAFGAFLFLALTFGMLRLTTVELSRVVAVSLIGFAAVTVADLWRQSDVALIELELMQLLILVLTMPWFVLLSGYVVRLRRDLSFREAKEHAARESEERLRQLLGAMPLAVVRTDRQGRAVYVNPRWVERTGRSEEENRGYGWMEVILPEDRARVMESCRGQPEMPKAVRREYRVLDRDRQVLWVEASSAAICDAEGQVTGYVGAAIDITQRKKAEEALRESEIRLRLAKEVSGIGIQDWHIDTGEMVWDAMTREYLGVRAEAAPTLELFLSAVQPQDRYAFRRAVERAMDPAVGRYEVEYRVRGVDTGIERWLESKGEVFFDGDTPVRLIGMAQEVTQRKAAEIALKEADLRKDQFLAMLAHELRNPLAPLRNAVQIMRLLPGGEELDQVRCMIGRQVAQLARLVDDLLDVSRITQGKVKLQRHPVDLRDVLDDALEISRPLIESRGHRLEVSCSDKPLWVEGDRVRLTQVVSNLLNNAAKFTEEHGRVGLGLDSTDALAVIRVRDDGVGIAPEMLPRVFDLFTQADHSPERSGGGLGIGLSLVRSLVEMHGGEVEACSEGPGRGSEFVVRLPLAAGLECPAEPAQKSGVLPRKHRILVVDDNADTAESMATVLQLSGHEVVSAHGASSALPLARRFRPEIVLLDIGLPGMDGYELARRLRELPEVEQSTLIAVTGYGQAEDRRKARDAGFAHHFVKPLDPDQLNELLATL